MAQVCISHTLYSRVPIGQTKVVENTWFVIFAELCPTFISKYTEFIFVPFTLASTMLPASSSSSSLSSLRPLSLRHRRRRHRCRSSHCYKQLASTFGFSISFPAYHHVYFIGWHFFRYLANCLLKTEYVHSTTYILTQTDETMYHFCLSFFFILYCAMCIECIYFFKERKNEKNSKKGRRRRIK